MTIAAIYARVSTDDQDPHSQVDTLSEAVKNKGWELYDIYVDKDASGKEWENRQAFVNCIDRAKYYDILMVTDVSRFTRNVRDGIDLIEKLEDENVKVYTNNTGAVLDMNTPMGFMSVMMPLMWAEYERRQIVDRVLASKAFKRKTRSFKGLDGRPRTCEVHGMSERECFRKYSCNTYPDRLEAWKKEVGLVE